VQFAHLILYIPIIFRSENYWSCPLGKLLELSTRLLQGIPSTKNVQSDFGAHQMDFAGEGDV